jgi:carboxylate-amine ligase
VRPSARYPTLEFRVADVCTSVDDAVLIAGLVRALMQRCAAAAATDRPYPAVRPELLRPAIWRAARHGLTEQLVDLDRLQLVPAGDAVAGLLEFVRPALVEWGEWSPVEMLAASLLERGTSADRQRSVLRRTGDVVAVVEWLAAETAGGSVPA